MNARKNTVTPPSSVRERLTHRELSWLSFNARVLDQAIASDNPLGERLRFLAIFANNLDEFFMVRVAGIRRLMNAGYKRNDEYGYPPAEIFDLIQARVREETTRLYRIYRRSLKELNEQSIQLKTYEELSNQEKGIVSQYFKSTVFPVMTPMAVDQGHPFPVLPSRTLAFVLQAQRGLKRHFAILPVPTVIPRLFRLPPAKSGEKFILLDEIIRNNLQVFFRGYKISAQGMFRIIRDSDLAVAEEYTDDLLTAIESEVKKRPRARAVWLEARKGLPRVLQERLCEEYGINDDNVVTINSDLDLTFLFGLVDRLDRPDLFYKPFQGAPLKYKNIFDRIKAGDFIVHRPFQAFDPVVDFVRKAANDPDVLAIKMTLYRTSGDSSFIKALKRAAANGKQVTVLVELKARFDEAKNIVWARELEQAGCHVIYGIPGLKIHSKIAFVVRQEEEGIQRYIHLSTGNYNENTARVYTDMGLFTADEDFARDISDVFNVISGYSLPPEWKSVISAPDDLRKYFFQLIDSEIANQRRSQNGRIFVKMNSLQDPDMIEKLYEASEKGVHIRLMVRGICCLIPGVPGMSSNIEVRSIVGRFLEHTRIFMFNSNDEPRIFMSSADWMTRNFDRRIELLFNIEQDHIKEHLQWLLETYWKDNQKSNTLQNDRTYAPTRTTGGRLNSQEFLLQHYHKG